MEYKSEETVLDLPIERQEELAKLMKMSHKDWVVMTKRDIEATNTFCEMLDKTEGKRPDGFTEEDAVRFQKKADSANPR